MPAACELLATNEAARLLKVHPLTLLRWVRADRVPVVRLTRRTFRFRLSDIEKLLETRAK